MGCSAPIEPEKAPERIVTTEAEGGSTVVTTPAPPTPATFVGCETQEIDPWGGLSRETRELVDADGRVLVRAEGNYAYDEDGFHVVETRTYDERGRVRQAKPAGFNAEFGFVYDGLDLQVSRVDGPSAGPLFRLRLDERGLIVGEAPYSAVWLDDVRPVELTWASETRRWTWDGEGFLVEATDSDSGRSCARRFTWDRTDRAVFLTVHDARGNARWSGAYTFDDEGRMIRALHDGHQWNWTHRDGWSAQTETLVYGTTFRRSAACHFPPTRSELARALAGVMWSHPQERRPDHLHSLYDLPIPSITCSYAE